VFSPITSDAHVLRAEERGNFESKVERITKIKKKKNIYIYIDADAYILSHFARPLVSYRQVEERLHAGGWGKKGEREASVRVHVLQMWRETFDEDSR